MENIEKLSEFDIENIEKLSEFDIENIEKFINTADLEGIPCISPKYIHRQLLALELIKKSPSGYFKIFGSDGYRSYGYYKSINTNIYFIESYLQELSSYFIVK
jgi:hypothetical protein